MVLYFHWQLLLLLLFWWKTVGPQKTWEEVTSKSNSNQMYWSLVSVWCLDLFSQFNPPVGILDTSLWVYRLPVTWFTRSDKKITVVSENTQG